MTKVVLERAGVLACMSCSSTTGPTSCRPEERLLFPVEVSLEQLLQSVKDTIEDYLQKEKLPFAHHLTNLLSRMRALSVWRMVRFSFLRV